MRFAQSWSMRLVVLFAATMIFGLAIAPTTSRADTEFAHGQPWGLEIALGWGRAPNSQYTATLGDFGFERDDVLTFDGFRVSLAIERKMARNFSLLLQANNLESRRYERDSGLGPDDTFVWNTWALGVHGRAWLNNNTGRFRGYAQVGVGPTIAITRLNTRLSASDTDFTEFRELQCYFHMSGLLGFEGMLGKHVGMFMYGGYVYARTPKNVLDERARGGGGLLLAGFSGRYGKK